MTYEQWDAIADAYIPLIGCISLITILSVGFRSGLRTGTKQLLATLVSTLYIYALMFADNYFQIWPSFGMDYSTHTALALVFVTYLFSHSKALKWVSVASMIAYAILMMYQHYHTLADIITTALCVLPVLWLCQTRLAKELNTQLCA
ncbi:hypothetical protein G3U99_12320 [Vibrio coralliilyticus OCN008]|uniref:hypothetical protein n=1 Tax=Vibrio coralliilyticus TaxID=190893 RepID=UPI0003911D5D|nr:hypothetical protein [Vibrio coralliilyticus]ERB63041.1 hypothetical protein N779_22890 [Vibrio coralliilyticus OCN008]QIJ84995.1 hypothetical protein G3U99_12320 [Vibrio coralliilyticus OCN008]